MKTTTLLTLGALIGTCSFAVAQDAAPERPERPQRRIPAEMLEKFDANKDGELSEDERKAMREANRAEMEKRRAEMLKKYDKDGNGELSEEERKTMREEMEAKRKALLEKYDADKNGRLSPEERKAAVDAGEELPAWGGPGGRGPRGEGGRRERPAPAEQK